MKAVRAFYAASQLRNRYKIRIPAPLPAVAWPTCSFCCRSGVRFALVSKLPIANLIPSLGFHKKKARSKFSPSAVQRILTLRFFAALSDQNSKRYYNTGKEGVQALSLLIWEGEQIYRPQQCLYFFPEPQGQGSLRPTLGAARRRVTFFFSDCISL